MLFFRPDREFLTEKRVRLYVLIDIIIGAVTLGLAFLCYRCQWSVIFTVVSIVTLVDSCAMRYAYEIKRTIIEKRGE